MTCARDFHAVSRQAVCGSCVAFTSIAMVQFYHCRRTNILLDFSEQYIVDCSFLFNYGRNGCEGGHFLQATEHIHNLDLELSRDYPYRSRVLACPFDQQESNPQQYGRYRMFTPNVVGFPPAQWDSILEPGPLFVGLSIDYDVLQYGGGVYYNPNARRMMGHAMLLVGHGRQGGLQYWLLRNSHGPYYGVEGHFKLAKAALPRLYSGSGQTFGDHTLVPYLGAAFENSRYNTEYMTQHQANVQSMPYHHG